MILKKAEVRESGLRRKAHILLPEEGEITTGQTHQTVSTVQSGALKSKEGSLSNKLQMPSGICESSVEGFSWALKDWEGFTIQRQALEAES